MKRPCSKLACVLILFFGTAAAQTDTVPVRWFADGSVTGGMSHLTRNAGMVVLTMEVAGLVPGDAFTVWWVVFNAPENCASTPCTDAEFADVTNAQIAVGNATGNVVKSDGTMEFGAVLRAGADAKRPTWLV